MLEYDFQYSHIVHMLGANVDDDVDDRSCLGCVMLIGITVTIDLCAALCSKKAVRTM